VNASQFTASIEAFPVADLPIAVEHALEERLRSSLSRRAVVLVGETHGVRENPLVLYTLMRRFDVRCLGLEWSPSLGPVIEDFLRGGQLAYEHIADSADGRITAGHFAVIRALSSEGRLDRLVLFSPLLPYSTWSDRDRDMARHLLAGVATDPAIAAAGNLHTSFKEHAHGLPMGVLIANERPSSMEINLEYLQGSYFNFGPKRMRRRFRSAFAPQPASLQWKGGRALLTVPEAHIASVPAG
jgi:hypothetical protein